MRSTLTLALISALLLACASAPPEIRSKGTVRGFVSYTADGVPQLRECDTGRRFLVGAMTSGQTLRLRERYERLSAEGRNVIAELSGYLTWDSEVGRIEQPSLLKVKAEKCKDNA